MSTAFRLFSASMLCVGLAAALPGCESASSRVPGDAAMIGSGTGNTTTQVAHDGTVFVYDKTWNKLVYSGEVREGQIVKVDAWHDKVFVDNQVVVEQIPLGEGSEYQIFVKPLPATASTTTTTVERHVVTEHEIHD